MDAQRCPQCKFWRFSKKPPGRTNDTFFSVTNLLIETKWKYRKHNNRERFVVAQMTTTTVTFVSHKNNVNVAFKRNFQWYQTKKATVLHRPASSEKKFQALLPHRSPCDAGGDGSTTDSCHQENKELFCHSLNPAKTMTIVVTTDQVIVQHCCPHSNWHWMSVAFLSPNCLWLLMTTKKS